MTARWRWLLLLSSLVGCARPSPSLEQLTHFHEIGRPRWSRQGDLAYLSDETGALCAHWLDSQGMRGHVSLSNVTLAAWNPSQQVLALQYDPDGSENTQLAEFDLASAQLRPLAVRPGFIHHFGTYSRRGRLAYSSNERSPEDFDLKVMGSEEFEASGYNVPLRFAPDGRRLLYYSQPTSTAQSLYELDLRRRTRQAVAPSRGDILYLSPAYQSSNRLWMLSNAGSNYLGLVEWQRDKRELVRLWDAPTDIEDWDYDRKRDLLAFSLNQRGYSALQVQPRKGGAALSVGHLPEGVYSQLDFRKDGSLTLVVDGPLCPASLWQVWPGTPQVKQLLGANPDLQGFPVPTPVRFAARDGTELGGLLSWPADARAGVVVLHGGPANQARPTFSPLFLDLARQGVAVLQLDVRGSTGYGRRFAELDNGVGRLAAIEDVEAGGRYLQSRGLKKLALMGHSYGGYLSWLSAVRQPDLWSAVVVGAGICDLSTYLAQTAPWRLGNRLAEYGTGSPSLSPLGQADQLKMPAFVYHGLHDTRVPITQGRRMAEALRRQGNRVVWLEFPDEGHRLQTPSNRRKLALAVDQFLVEILLKP